MTKISIILADDHPLIRAGIRSVISNQVDMELLGEADSGNEAIQLCQKKTPNILLLDLKMPGLSPAETITFLNRNLPGVKIIVLTAYDDDAYVRALVKLGIKGYILKDEATEILPDAIYAVCHGGMWFSKRISEKFYQIQNDIDEEGETNLSDREMDVLKLMGQGFTNEKIAKTLNITARTVRFHIENLMKKIHVENRVQAVTFGIQMGWIYSK